jgi:hypothetical protein
VVLAVRPPRTIKRASTVSRSWYLDSSSASL